MSIRHDTFDPIVNRVITKLANRSDAGMKKYGVAMTRKDVSELEWLRHAQEEAMDMANYLERLIWEKEQELGIDSFKR